ncbi:MAG: ferritin-like domain-containing protein [Sphingobium sp.]
MNGPLTSVGQACAKVLLTPEPRDKLMAARSAARDWRLGRLAHRFDVAIPDAPARPAKPQLLAPRHMPRRGGNGSARGRIAMIHALAHIEFVAIDLAFDMIGRFGGGFRPAFTDMWMGVGADEAMHFALLDRRLRQMGSHYGALPAHDGLWQAAQETAHDALARLAVVPMVLEARALDITPATIARFAEAGDGASVRILERILQDEIRHVSVGTNWFNDAAKRRGLSPTESYQNLVRAHNRGKLKPPFNVSARRQAGLTLEYYDALAT